MKITITNQNHNNSRIESNRFKNNETNVYMYPK